MGLGVLGSGLGWRWLLVVVVAMGDWGWRWVCGCVRCVGVRGIWEEEDGFWVLPLRPTPPSSPASPLPYLAGAVLLLQRLDRRVVGGRNRLPERELEGGCWGRRRSGRFWWAEQKLEVERSSIDPWRE